MKETFPKSVRLFRCENNEFGPPEFYTSSFRKTWLSLVLVLFTVCGYGQISLSENFDAGTALPTGWTSVGSVTATATNACGGAGNSIRSNVYGTTTNQTKSITTDVLSSNGGQVSITLDYNLFNWSGGAPTASGSAELRIYSSSDGTNFTLVHTEPSSNLAGNSAGCSALTIPSFGVATGNAYIRFEMHRVTGDFYFHLDNISITQGAAPSCMQPSNLTATNITPTSLDLGWTDNNPAPPTDGWDIEYGLAGFTPTGNPSVTGTTTNPHQIGGLTANTAYDFYVRAACTSGSDESAWAGPFSFTTPCTPYTATYTQDFDALATPAIDPCWTPSLTGATSTYANIISSSTQSVSASNSVRFYNSGDLSGTYLLVSPQFTDLDNTKRIKFEMYKNIGSDADGDVIEVGTMSDPTDATTYTTFQTFAAGDFTEDAWTSIILNFDTYTGTDQYIAFKYIPGTGTYNYWYMDDFVYELAPSCLDPTILTATNITSNSADLGWTENNPTPSTMWDVEWDTTGFTPGTGNMVSGTTSNPHTISGLLSNTTYEFYVRAQCGSSNSPWSGPYSFTTLCANVTSYPFTEDFSSFLPSACWDKAKGGSSATGPATVGSASWGADGFLNNGSSGAARINIYSSADMDWLLTPTFDIPATGAYSLIYDVGATQYAVTNGPLTTPWESDDSMNVMITTDGGATWTSLLSYNDQNVPSNNGQTEYIDLSAYAGMTVQFAFLSIEGSSDGGADLDCFIDNFMVDLSPTCFPATDLLNTSVTDVTADFSFIAPTTGASANFAWLVMPMDSTPDFSTAVATGTIAHVTGITSYNVTASSLSPSTDYDFYVITDCGGTDSSSWAGPVNFTTLCAATIVTSTTPFYDSVENVSTTTNSTMSNCWSSNPSGTTSAFRWNVDGSGSTPSSSTGPSGAQSGTNYFYTEASEGATGAAAELTSPLLDVSGLTSPYLEFSYHMYGATIANLYIQVWDGSAFVTVDSIVGQQQGTQSLPWETKGIDISSVAGATTQIRFLGTKGSSYTGDISLDDIIVMEAPACASPGNPTTVAMTAAGIDITWTAPAGTAPASYNWIAVPEDEGTTSTNAISGTATTTSATITGLTSGSTYDIFVQADCGGDSSTWAGPLTESAPCVEALPYSNDFENNIVANGLSQCWAKQNANGDFYHWSNAPQVPCNGTTGLRIDDNGTGNSHLDLVYSPLFDMTAGTSYFIEFSYLSSDTSAVQRLTLYAGDGQSSANMSEIIFRDTSITSGVCQKVTIEYTPSASGLVSFGFLSDVAGGNGDIGIDDFSVKVAPTTSAVIVASNADSCQEYHAYGVTGNVWHYIMDANGEYLGAINPNGDTLGNVIMKMRDAAAVDESDKFSTVAGSNFKYVPRIYQITPDMQPVGDITVALFYHGAELDDMNASSLGTGNSTHTLPDLELTKFDDPTQDCDVHNNTSPNGLGISIIQRFNVGSVPTSGTQDFGIIFNVPSFSEYYLHEPTNLAPLALHFENFRGHLENNQIQLLWDLFDAKEGDNILVEKLVDNQWKAIGDVKVNSSESYSFIDRDVQVYNTYRLSCAGHYSTVIRLQSSENSSIAIYPNPVTQQTLNVTLENQDAADLYIRIYDAVGREVRSMQFSVNSAVQTESLDMTGLIPGHYMIQIDNGFNTIFNSQFMIQ